MQNRRFKYILRLRDIRNILMKNYESLENAVPVNDSYEPNRKEAKYNYRQVTLFLSAFLNTK